MDLVEENVDSGSENNMSYLLIRDFNARVGKKK